MFFRKSANKTHKKSSLEITASLSKTFTSNDLTAETLKVFDLPQGTALILAFVSPNCDFAKVTGQLSQLMPFANHVVTIMTAGELGGGLEDIYHDTPDNWDGIVIHAFGKQLFSKISAHALSVVSPNKAEQESTKGRVNYIASELNKIHVPFDIDSHNTIALLYFDGLTQSEHFFTEALYRSSKYPCYFIGGSAGGKLDFQNANVGLDGQVRNNQVLMIFCKIAPEYRYGILKTHNFEPSGAGMDIGEFDPFTRTLHSVLTSHKELITPVEFLARYFKCKPDQVGNALKGYSFGVEIGGSIYIRSVAAIHDNGSIQFFGEMHFGEKLLLVRAKSLSETTSRDYQKFT